MKSIRIVLVNPSHPGNIGATARAMKTMGLSSLYLVEPLAFPHPKAQAMASHADDILNNAVVVDNLLDAIKNCQLVFATSARDREKPWPMLSPKAFAELAVTQTPADTPIAILFGRESIGLTNEELQYAHYHVQIPSVPEYYSLNLAQAVQILCYEMRLATLSAENTADPEIALASIGEQEGLFEQLETGLIQKGFIDPSNPRQTMTKLRRLFAKTRLETLEVNILRGVIKALSAPNT